MNDRCSILKELLVLDVVCSEEISPFVGHCEMLSWG